MSLLETDPETGDTFFTGSLEEALVLVEQDRHVVLIPRNGFFTVELRDKEPVDAAAEWGSAATPEQALRFALGAYFGPDDYEGYADYLAEALYRGTWPNWTY